MECIGSLRSPVVSVASDVTGSAVVVTLNEAGVVHVWDTRAKQPKPPAYVPTNAEEASDASEICFFPEAHKAVTLCGNSVHVVDLRTQRTSFLTYTHGSEVVQLLPRRSRDVHTDQILLVDEDGFMFPFQVSAAQPQTTLDSSVFGTPYDLSAYPHAEQHNVYGFGALTNYCAGLALVEDAASGVDPHLLAVAMDSTGALYTRPDRAVPFELPQDDCAETVGAQMVNPPLPNCVASCGAYVAVGKANGVYSVFQLDATSELNELLMAPGDAMNGLIHVDWVGIPAPRSLLTVSLCGDITVWDVGGFMSGAPVEGDVTDSEEGVSDALPDVQAALSLRECLGADGCGVYANTCCAIPSSSHYVLGDTKGHVMLFDISTDA